MIAWQICANIGGYNRVTHCSHSVSSELYPLDKNDDPPMMPHLHVTTPRHHAGVPTPAGSVDRPIRAFLNGESHGQDVLGALYGAAAEEPIPERLRALLKN